MSMLVQLGGGSCFVTFTQTNAPHNSSMHLWEQVIWHKFERVIQHWEMSTEESRARSEFVQVLGADEQQPTRTGLPLPTPDGVPGHYSPWSTCNTHCMLGEAHIQNFKKVTTSQNLKKMLVAKIMPGYYMPRSTFNIACTVSSILHLLDKKYFRYSNPLESSHSGNLQISVLEIPKNWKTMFNSPKQRYSSWIHHSSFRSFIFHTYLTNNWIDILITMLAGRSPCNTSLQRRINNTLDK